ncbi:asparagine synthase-related protein [Streptomyces sp. H39-C1]|uniref:asparagine synthase-related protein n=1 Tax=Streptomyces sp. H39-C1 TaxID=3004355 RepID=UPI0022AE8EF6|nr:asparagine synthase-related protein [Streptomyces sp. H39-C1]MCZ4098096.1 asparagine synthase-related protein [Streptomyces sp. H39-C1]
MRPVVPAAHPGGLRATFAASVAGLTERADTIGVSVSGGLDSLATLVHACAVADGRRVIAFTVALTDDQGRSCVPVVRKLLRDVGLAHVEVEVIDPARHWVDPRWSAHGPRLDALPGLNAAVAQRAVSRGVEVLLSGLGSDELLGVPRYATAPIARRYGLRAAARYAGDVARSGPGLLGEALAVAARVMPAQASAGAYWAANWPEWCDPQATPVLAEPYRGNATHWARSWVREQVSGHAGAGRSWVQADAHDAFYPHEAMGPAGDVVEASPFLTEQFLAAAFAVPLADRYRPDLPSGYWRCKSLVLSLLPDRAIRALPRTKQYYSAAMAHEAAGLDTSGPLLVTETGLIDRAHLARETDTAVLLVVSAIERWLIGAIEHGARIN